MLNLRVKGPSGQKTITCPSTATVDQLKQIITGQFPLIGGFDILVGFPPAALISSPTATCGDLIDNNAVVVVKAHGGNSSHTASGNTTTGTQQRGSTLQPPPGIDADTWASLPEDIRRELRASYGDEEDDQNDDDEEEEENAPSRHRPMPIPPNTAFPRVPTHQTTQTSVHTPSTSNLHFGARVATLGGEESSGIAKPKIGSSAPRTFGARVATLPKNTGGG
jgi:hypothetical protein